MILCKKAVSYRALVQCGCETAFWWWETAKLYNFTSQAKWPCRANQSNYRSRHPLKLLQIYVCFVLQCDALTAQERCLFRPARCQTPGVVNDPVAGEISVELCTGQHARYEPGIFWVPGQRCDLPVGRNTACGDLFHNGKNLIGEIIIQLQCGGAHGGSSLKGEFYPQTINKKKSTTRSLV